MKIVPTLWILMTWCFSTIISVATVLSKHLCIYSCVGVNLRKSSFQIHLLVYHICLYFLRNYPEVRMPQTSLIIMQHRFWFLSPAAQYITLTNVDQYIWQCMASLGPKCVKLNVVMRNGSKVKCIYDYYIFFQNKDATQIQWWHGTNRTQDIMIWVKASSGTEIESFSLYFFQHMWLLYWRS